MAKMGAGQFLKELATLGDTIRAQIETDCEGFKVDAKASAERIKKVKDPLTGYEYFCQTYFPHYVDKTKSEFHKYLFTKLPEISAAAKGIREAILAPRGEAKSTLATQLHTLWEIVTEQTHFTIIIMDAFESQAAPMLEAIKAELDTNPRLAMDFPDIAGQGPLWRSGVMVTRNNIKVQAFGAGQKLRGIRHGAYRPDRIKLDDIENDENVRSPEQREKLFKWLTKGVFKLGPPDGSVKIFYIGTLLHYDSVLAKTIKLPSWNHRKFKAVIQWPANMDLWEKWEEIYRNEGNDAGDDFYQQNKAAMDKDAKVSWPEKRPILFLMKERADDHHAFDCEYQNDPTNEEDATFTNIQFWVHAPDRWVLFGACDPSLGKKNRKRDPAAIGVGGFDRNKGTLFVIEALIKRLVPNLIIQKIIDYQREYNCLRWSIEAVQFQEFMRTQLIEQGNKQGVQIPAIGVTPNTDKNLRVESLEPYVNRGSILIRPHHTVLHEQLRHWPEHDHDDGPDMLQMLWAISSTGAGGISKVASAPRRGTTNFNGFGHHG